jgi:hypothetical protein
MNLSDDKQPPTGRNAGAVPVWGPAHAAPAHPHYQVGAVGFGAGWTMEDSMAASIVRLECEKSELRAEVALLREEQKILRAETIVEELDNEYLRGRLDEWRECAEKLHAAVCYLEPALLYDDPEGGFTNEREAVREFMRMKEGT